MALTMAVMACAPVETATPGPSPSPTHPLIPYRTATPSPTAPPATALSGATITPLPTATPFTYCVVKDDTLLAIAFRFGVTVDEIMAANPGLNPNLLSIGTELVIPLGESEQGVIPTPTPVPVDFEAPRCYASTDGGLWCLMSVENDGSSVLEGISGRIDLFGPGGGVVASQQAVTPLNLLPVGQKLPLAAYFPAPVPPWQTARGHIGTAFTYAGDDGRYLPARLREQPVVVDEGGLQAVARGTLVFEGEGEEALRGLVVVAVVAYDGEGHLVGLRRWEQEVEWQPGGEMPFEVRVFSLGPSIAEVDVLAEIRRLPPPVEGPEGSP